MSMTLTVGGADRRIRFDWEAAAGAWAARAEPLGLAARRGAAPVSRDNGDPRKPKGGTFRDSITARTERSPGSLMIAYYSRVPYAPFILAGTRPHPITARNAPRLAFIGGDGAWHFPVTVSHPGTKPDRFPEKVIPPLSPLLGWEFARAAREAVLP